MGIEGSKRERLNGTTIQGAAGGDPMERMIAGGAAAAVAAAVRECAEIVFAGCEAAIVGSAGIAAVVAAAETIGF